jgi:ubiquinone/menaquinone biosynthesis C-methylase UbiE
MSEANADILARQAAAYVKGRPDYPVEIEGWLSSELGIGAGKIVADLGSGTGKFLPRLLAIRARVIAIEPLTQMRSHLEALHPGVEAIEGRAQAIPLADRSVDAVTCAQCFHLFATDEALREIRRVLKPGGALGLIWNIRAVAVPWVAGIIEIMAPYEHRVPHIPHYESDRWRAVFPAEGFSELRETRFSNPHTGSPENVVIDRVLSTYSIAKLFQPERESVVGRLRNLIAASPELAGKETITFPNECCAYSCRKTDRPPAVGALS